MSRTQGLESPTCALTVGAVLREVRIQHEVMVIQLCGSWRLQVLQDVLGTVKRNPGHCRRTETHLLCLDSTERLLQPDISPLAQRRAEQSLLMGAVTAFG